METELTSILDEFAPLKTGHRTVPRKAKTWLSPEAVDAKKHIRRLERQLLLLLSNAFHKMSQKLLTEHSHS